MLFKVQTSNDGTPLHASSGADKGHRSSRITQLFTWQAGLTIWLPFVVITTFHYFTPSHHHWVHDVLRRTYYLPIVVAAMRSGLAGGVLFSGLVTLAYLPHAFMDIHHVDPAGGLEKGLEIALYFVVAAVAGYLSNQERRRQSQLAEALHIQRRLIEQLVRAGRLAALGEVVAGIAHEVKNPIHALKGTAEIIDRVVPTDCPERAMWQLHREELDRLADTANRFLSFAQPQKVDVTPIDLAEVAVRLRDLAGAHARQQQVALQVKLPENKVMVLGNLDQLAQVGLNITMNAVRAIGNDSGQVTISVSELEKDERPGGALIIENNGPRIDPQLAEHLFDPFYSGSDSTGLGLSIAARIVAQQNGMIEVDGEGLGTRFTVWLPLN